MKAIRENPVAPLNEAEYQLAELLRALMTELTTRINRMDEFEWVQLMSSEEVLNSAGFPGMTKSTMELIAALRSSPFLEGKSVEEVARLFRHARDHLVGEWTDKALAKVPPEAVERAKAKGTLISERKT